MPEFILGVTTGKEAVRDNILLYDDMQIAMQCSDDCVSVFADDLDKAKDKFLELKERDFSKS